jgi:hypothetical protein
LEEKFRRITFSTASTFLPVVFSMTSVSFEFNEGLSINKYFYPTPDPTTRDNHPIFLKS